MAMESERSSSSKPLHNFSLPDGLRWGNQKFLRCMKVNSNGKVSAVVRRPSSSSSSAAASFSTRVSNNADRFVRSSFGKRKEREEFIDRTPSPAEADDRRGSDFRKFGSGFKVHPAPSSPYTESYRKLKSIKSCNGEHGGGGSREGDGIAAVREKLMLDLQTETDKMKDAMMRDGLDTPDQVHDNNHTVPPVASVSPANNASPSNAIPPWKLRTRRAAECKAPKSPNGAGPSSVAGGNVSVMATGQGLNPNAIIPNPKSPPVDNKAVKAPHQTSGDASPSIDTKERAKLSVSLTKHEIQEDFLAFAGRRPPRRPHKRPRYVQKVMDTLFPGLWLTEITADMYKVVEFP